MPKFHAHLQIIFRWCYRCLEWQLLTVTLFPLPEGVTVTDWTCTTLKCHLKVNWWAGNLNVKFLAWTIKKDNFFTIPKKLQLCHENVMVKNVTIFNKMIWQQSYNFVTKMWQGILICFCYNFVIRHFSDIATTLSWECDGWKRNKLSWLCKSSKFKLCCKIVLT